MTDLTRYPSVHFLRERAKERLPHFAWEFVDSSTGIEDGKARNDRITVVSGLPRSGTSMLMQMMSSLLAERPELGDATAAIAPALEELQRRIDPETYGGAHLVGTGGVVVVAHGSSSRTAIANALTMAAEGGDHGLIDAVTSGIEALA